MATKTLEQIDTSLSRWKTRLRRAMTAIDKLEKQRKRLVNRATAVRVSVPAPAPARASAAQPQVWSRCQQLGAAGEKLEQLAPADDDIPAFLRRGQAAQKAVDTVIAEQIKAEQAETKKKKAAGRIAKLKAKQSGETKRMPLSGRSALAAIRNG